MKLLEKWIGGYVMSISQVISDFVTYAIESGGWMDLDRLYLQNRVAALIGIEDLESVIHQTPLPNVDDLVKALVETAHQQGLAATDESMERLSGQLYDFLTPPPSVLNALFAQRYDKDATSATDYFHFISRQSHSIVEDADMHLMETSQGVFCQSVTQGTEEKNIPTERHEYPRCGLCFDNEGFVGDGTTMTRMPFRYIRMNLHGESFGFHYVPYPLWHEHALFVSEEDRYQMMNLKTVNHLLQLAKIFPHYFIAAEMDQLPEGERPEHIVYQGGRDELPLFSRQAKATFKLEHYDSIFAEVLDYPLTVCRFTSESMDELQSFISHVIQAWRIYQSDGIEAFQKDGALNHAVDLFVRMNQDRYEFYVAFRQVDAPRIRLAQVAGVEPVRKENASSIEKLEHILMEADPFDGNREWIDHWMAKMNTLGD